MKSSLFKYLGGDKVLWVTMLFFGLISIISVFSFVFILQRQHDSSVFFYILKHTVFVVGGMVSIYLTSKINYTFYFKLSRIAPWIAILLLVLTMLFAKRVNAADRWLEIPFIKLSFQPSDIARVALMMSIARILAIKKDLLYSFKNGFLPVFLPVLVICALIIKEDLSTAAIIFGSSSVLIFIGGAKIKHMLTVIASAIVLFFFMILISKSVPGMLPRVETWSSRWTSAYNSDDATKDTYQIDHAQGAIYNGQLLGKGPGRGDFKEILPLAYADFYFAAYVEEFGLIGAGILVLLYLILFYRSIKIGLSSEKLFGTYLAIGLGFQMLTQAMTNMLVCTKIIPVTGQNMPLLALGGTSMIFSCISIGMIISVSKGLKSKKVKSNKINKNTAHAIA